MAITVRYPAIPEPQPDLNTLTAAVSAIKQAVEALLGVKGARDNQAVTYGSLPDAVTTIGTPVDVSGRLTQSQVLARVSLGV